ncbi:Peptidyl-prolyl cis-trans isomerase PASTICCINO1 [Acorus calamus]|uniref:Peptidyl-prolyl cis-trans isomerase PASTICCINO1 n=1 Tax=Acorus calamus TaxID=4465 RepID=A0AAV9C6I1_ACOCL|nr:Peptidyl-prolyl cis-trans isomerase PASTICCINO1 [Acorus calamus]
MKASETAQSLLNAEREHSRTIMFSDEEFKSLQLQENKLFKDGKFELAKAKYEKVLREYNHVNPKDEEEGKIFLNSRRGIGSAKYFHRHISR